ncbi:hypothetical protein JCM21900_000579 [Sporobolomyces salmonicolor]
MSAQLAAAGASRAAPSSNRKSDGSRASVQRSGLGSIGHGDDGGKGRSLALGESDLDFTLDLMALTVEQLKEHEEQGDDSCASQSLLGLGIQVSTDSPFLTAPRLRVRRPKHDEDDDTMSIASTTDADLNDLVAAFPTPPMASSSPSFAKRYGPPSPAPTSPLPAPPQRSPPHSLTLNIPPPLGRRASFSSELTVATTTSIETPSPRTPTAPELPAAVPRPNAAALRRVRSFAKPVSVYFSPDRPPSLPLPPLPRPLSYCPSSLGPPPPSASTISFAISSFPSAVPSPSSSSFDSFALSPAPAPIEPIRRRPPSAPPDRPLPPIPTEDDVPASPKLCRLSPPTITFPLPSDRLPALVDPDETPPSRPLLLPVPPSPPPSAPPPRLSAPPWLGRSEDPHPHERRRTDSSTSSSSLNVQEISASLERLASASTASPGIGASIERASPYLGSEEMGRVGQAELPEENGDETREMERTRRLISRVSSVIKMRKMSVASTATSSSGGAERTRYKAYKLARRPSYSPALSRRSGHSPGSSSRGSSDSSASEELFDLAFDSPNSSDMLSPPSFSDGEFGAAGRRGGRETWSYSGRRRSSATTVGDHEADGEETVVEQERVKADAIRRADEITGRSEWATPRVLRTYTSQEALRQSDTSIACSPRTLMTARSTPSLRRPSQAAPRSPPFLRRPMVSGSSVSGRSSTISLAAGGKTRLKPLWTAETAKRSLLPSPSPSLTGTPAALSPPSSPPHPSLSPSRFAPLPSGPMFSRRISTASSASTTSTSSTASLSFSASLAASASPLPAISSVLESSGEGLPLAKPRELVKAPPTTTLKMIPRPRNSSLPAPISASASALPTGLRRPSAPASSSSPPSTAGPGGGGLHKRKPSLAMLEYKHTPAAGESPTKSLVMRGSGGLGLRQPQPQSQAQSQARMSRLVLPGTIAGSRIARRP